MARRMNIGLQRSKLEDRCWKYNDDCDKIDFISELDSSLSLSENRANIESKFSTFIWEDPDPEVPAKFYEQEVISSLQEEAEPFSYTILKKYKLEGLERDSRRADRLKKKLEICERTPVRRPSRKGVCEIREVSVKAHKRCLPRR